MSAEDDATRDGKRALFSQAEQQAMRTAFVSGTPVRCPSCDVVMAARAIGGGSFGLGYARQREWLLCPRCKRSVMFDVKRGTRN